MSAIPPRVVQAVLAIEDHRFYEHPGIDPIGMLGAFWSNLRGKRAYTAGGSTITQQLVRNVFLPKFEGFTLQSARAKSINPGISGNRVMNGSPRRTTCPPASTICLIKPIYRSIFCTDLG